MTSELEGHNQASRASANYQYRRFVVDNLIIPYVSIFLLVSAWSRLAVLLIIFATKKYLCERD